jgi:hypothetical protein
MLAGITFLSFAKKTCWRSVEFIIQLNLIKDTFFGSSVGKYYGLSIISESQLSGIP